MRVVGGALRGRRLVGPADDGGMARLRPTSDRMREGIFNILAHGNYPDLGGARVLDVFAGTGAMGIEALSRGASEAVFLDNGKEARGLLKQNRDALGLADRMRVMPIDAARMGASGVGRFDLVFCDAPYGRGLTEPVLAALAEGGWLAEGAALVVETGAEEDVDAPAAFEEVGKRTYGKGKIRLYRVADDAGRNI